MIVERQYVNPMEMTFIGEDGSMGAAARQDLPRVDVLCGWVCLGELE